MWTYIIGFTWTYFRVVALRLIKELVPKHATNDASNRIFNMLEYAISGDAWMRQWSSSALDTTLTCTPEIHRRQPLVTTQKVFEQMLWWGAMLRVMFGLTKWNGMRYYLITLLLANKHRSVEIHSKSFQLWSKRAPISRPQAWWRIVIYLLCSL